MILLGSYACYTTNTLDIIETFIAETYVQLVATESKCYSTGGSTVLCCGHSVNELLRSVRYCKMA